jgi:hypothetical protein
MIDPIREICGVSEVTHGFKKNLRKDAALNEYKIPIPHSLVSLEVQLSVLMPLWFSSRRNLKLLPIGVLHFNNVLWSLKIPKE